MADVIAPDAYILFYRLKDEVSGRTAAAETKFPPYGSIAADAGADCFGHPKQLTPPLQNPDSVSKDVSEVTEVCVGDHVTVTGLVATQSLKHNGKVGIITSAMNVDTGRYNLELLDGPRLKVKIANMKLYRI